jgi:hypothetical protein
MTQPPRPSDKPSDLVDVEAGVRRSARRGLLPCRLTSRVPREVLARLHISFSGEKRTWTSAYRTVSSYLKCPSITSGPSIDAATSRWICREPEEAAGEMATVLGLTDLRVT